MTENGGPLDGFQLESDFDPAEEDVQDVSEAGVEDDPGAEAGSEESGETAEPETSEKEDGEQEEPEHAGSEAGLSIEDVVAQVDVAKEALRESQTTISQLTDLLERQKQDNAKLRKLLDEEPAGESEPDGEVVGTPGEKEEKALTRKEVLELLSDPTVQQKREEATREAQLSAWRGRVVNGVQGLVDSGFIAPGSEDAKNMQDFLDNMPPQLVGHPDALKYGVRYMESKRRPVGKPPIPDGEGAAGGQTPKKPKTREIGTGEGVDAFKIAGE